ncbi:unnamed protein product [Orchesella dallaii]|uniref:receptor protein-tyrosine kinase n=1 Tax=Orchesella dallaii TaxID=48710 RepID=A0ABP1REQ8_9HEXA
MKRCFTWEKQLFFILFSANGKDDYFIHRIDSFHHVPMMANTGFVDISRAHVQPPKDGEGICQVYKGDVCKRFIENRTIYVHSEESQIVIESKLQEALKVIQHSEDISARCSEFAIPSLCYSAFPLCPDNLGGGPEENLNFVSPRRLCREECELLEHDLCRQEYALAKRHPLIGQQLAIPECAELPPLGSKESASCIRLGLPHLTAIVEDHTCYKEKGMNYRGKIRETESGEPCRPWSHQLSFKSSDYSELMGGHNYCRNPGGIEQQPWCFSNSEHFRREPCKVPKCGIFGYESKIWLPVTGGVAALLLMMFLICIICCCKRGRSKMSATKSVGSRGSMQGLEMSSLLRKSGNPKAPEIPIGNVQFLQELGEGAFGKVYKGEAILRPGDPLIRVAIKTLKASATPKTRQDFVREHELMAELKHPNIVCLLGVITKEEPRCMLFEYMSQGDLHEYLISHSPRNDSTHHQGNDYGSHKVLEPNEMLFIATQIAAGMEYLAAHHYVHRDLAARNALVGESLTVKISDFGLSRDIYSSDYYRVQSKSLLPVRWMPPESILYGKFTTESDVWAFGVVLWEIYSYGLQPYYGYSNQEVIEMIRSRQLLPCPDLCPPRMYALMVECWAEMPHRRPSFEELSSRLKQWLLPLLGPNSHFSQHLNYPMAAPGSLSCASNNSMSSHQSSNTGPTSNNTNSTNISNMAMQQQAWQQQQQYPRTPQNHSGPQQSPSHCVAYQSTPIVHCPVNCGTPAGMVNGGRFSPQQTMHSFQQPQGVGTPNMAHAHAHFHGKTFTTHTHHGYPQSIGSSNSAHSHSPYRVLMESKATNI